MFEPKESWDDGSHRGDWALEDYQGSVPRWCSGCGDHSVLGSLQRLARDEKLAPEQTVVVSGIGCSSRFPHYMKTYGFHGLHGRPLPVASGVRARRPDLNIFVVTGDGDCCAIGTAHWIHAIRYNMKMTVLMLDNSIYGLTKMQTSPTTPQGGSSNTHPFGSPLPALNPIMTTLSISNVSFVAQSIDWNPPHLYETLRMAHHHPGLAFVRVLQRCPHYMPKIWSTLQEQPERVLLMTHEDGILLPPPAAKMFATQQEHDPANMTMAREIAERPGVVPIGLFYRNLLAARYDEFTKVGGEMPAGERLDAAQKAMDQFRV